jgi:hypothetical protein
MKLHEKNQPIHHLAMSKSNSKFKTIPRKKEKEGTSVTFPNQKKETLLKPIDFEKYGRNIFKI